MATWEKDQTMLFIDFSDTPSAPEWKRLRKSTVFDLAFNPETETQDYIDQRFPTDILKNYKPSMDQETMLEEGDELFEEMFPMMNELPTGTNAIKPVLIVFPKKATDPATSFLAWKVDCSISFSNLNTVDRKLSFSLAFAGDIDYGSVAVSAGVPTFTSDSEA